MNNEIITSPKAARLEQLEAIIENDYLAFVRVGNALLEIRNERLYEEGGYNDFREYLEERWSWKNSYAYYQINASYIYGYLKNSTNVEFYDDDEKILPSNEGQTRPLTKLATFKAVETGRKEPDLWGTAWTRAVQLARLDNDVVTDKHVNQAVNEIIKSNKLKELEPAEVWAGQWGIDDVYVADVTSREWLDTIPENSIDLIITDPPWRPDAEDNAYSLYEAVGRVALKGLKPGGICAVYLGKLDFPLLIQIMMEYLDYEWIFASYQPQGRWSFRKTQYKECWRPIGIFRKPGDKHETIYTPDAIESKREKTYHEWQQGIEPVKLLIEKYTAPGQLVLDPFVGGGTTPLAAKEKGRHYLAFDIDKETAATAKGRVDEFGK